jgi:hypothetical protein
VIATHFACSSQDGSTCQLSKSFWFIEMCSYEKSQLAIICIFRAIFNNDNSAYAENRGKSLKIVSFSQEQTIDLYG